MGRYRDGFSYKFALGLSGIGVGIELLSQRKFIDCNNTSELCFELNNQIMTQNIYRLTDYTFETGLSGIIYYVLIHIKIIGIIHLIKFFSLKYLKNAYR